MPPPHVSDAFPVQGVLQLDAAAGTPPAANEFPQSDVVRRIRSLKVNVDLTALIRILRSGIYVAEACAVANASLAGHSNIVVVASLT